VETRDIVISAFAQSAKRIPLDDGTKLSLQGFSQPIDVFTEPPIVLAVDASTEGEEVFYDKAFGRELAKYRDADGSILRRFIASHLVGVKVRRIALVGFSAGGVFVKGVLASPDAAMVDTAIFLDAIHLSKSWDNKVLPESVGPLVNYGVRSALAEGEWDGPLMVQAHTEIATPHPSVTATVESAAAITAGVFANSPASARSGYNPELLLAGPPPPGVTLGPSTGLPAPAKHWAEVPPPLMKARGNYYAMNFGGTYGADHAFIAWFVQRGIWRAMLAPRWNEGLDCKPPKPASGLGQAFCGPGGIVVPDGTFPTPVGPNWPAALLGLVVGATVGFVGGGMLKRRRLA
jgi:hypothetical protein